MLVCGGARPDAVLPDNAPLHSQPHGRTKVNRTTSVAVLAAALAGASVALTACETAPKSQSERLQLQDDAQATIREFKAKDAGIQRFFDTAHAYAVFPEITKGGAIIGGAYGRGAVYQNGRFVGYADVSQGSIGAQLGGQAWRQIIFFESSREFDNFKRGNFAFSANASAVAADKGGAAAANYADGVVVFVLTSGGLMVDASLGGQNFDFEAAP